MREEIEKMGVIRGNETRGVLKTKEDGSFWYFIPYEQLVAMSFMSDVRDICFVRPVLWGRPKITGEEQYKMAKEIYDRDYKKLNLSEGYLKSYEQK